LDDTALRYPDDRRGRAIRVELILRNAVGDPVATAAIETAGSIVLDIPLPAATGAIYTLDTEGGGDIIAGDPRVLNFRVFGLRWAVPD
jgi:hypothetical protein